MLSDPAKRTMQLHICPPECTWEPTGESLLRASGYWVVGAQKLPWHTLLEDSPPKREERDELAKLRALHEERQAGGARETDSPRGGSEKKAKAKKKKKGEEKDKKAGKDRGGRQEDPGEDDGGALERGQKSLSALYEGTPGSQCRES